MNIKKTLQTIGLSLGALLIVTTATYAIGTLAPATNPIEQTATQYTLNDIYTKLTTGNSTSTKSGLFTTPTGNPVASFATLTEIYNAIPATLSLVASTTTVPVGINRATTTLTEIDADLTASNIVNGVSIFGITGTNTGPALQWSAQTTDQTWTQATLLCSTLTEGSVPAGTWRLPTIHELVAAIEDDWIDGVGDRFALSTNYWSGTENDSDNAWVVNWGVYYGYSNKNNQYSVRCVR